MTQKSKKAVVHPSLAHAAAIILGAEILRVTTAFTTFLPSFREKSGPDLVSNLPEKLFRLGVPDAPHEVQRCEYSKG
jgi:hypothetical protein